MNNALAMGATAKQPTAKRAETPESLIDNSIRSSLFLDFLFLKGNL
jgi:hypothetical protein